MSIAIILRSIKNGTINDPQEFGDYPLHLAVKSNALDLVEELISHGANIDVKNTDEETPLHIALKRRSFEIVK